MQDSRASWANRDGNPICPSRAFPARLAFHAPRSVELAGFFSILLESLAPSGPVRGMYSPL